MRPSNFVGIVLLVLIWVCARIYPLAHAMPFSDWEIWEAHKLMDYGFFARHGAMIDVQQMTGTLPHPEDYNFVDHPYPVLWFDALLFRLFGVAGVTTTWLVA